MTGQDPYGTPFCLLFNIPIFPAQKVLSDEHAVGNV